jgi:hypothetical protein
MTKMSRLPPRAFTQITLTWLTPGGMSSTTLAFGAWLGIGVVLLLDVVGDAVGAGLLLCVVGDVQPANASTTALARMRLRIEILRI